MKLKKLEKETLENAKHFEHEHIMQKNLCVLVIHKETKEILHVMRFTLFRKWLKVAGKPQDMESISYELKLFL